jgi:aldehyde dehydrogenase (NAD+)
MHSIDHVYVDGAFRMAYGRECRDLINPATEERIGETAMGNTRNLHCD